MGYIEKVLFKVIKIWSRSLTLPVDMFTAGWKQKSRTEINIHLQVHVQSTLQDDNVRHIVVDLAYTCIVTEIELVSDLRVGFPRVLWFPLP